MNQTNIQTEADALTEIVTWSADRPDWQRDALRRLIVEGELSEADLSQVIDLCTGTSQTSLPLKAEHVTGHKVGAPTVALRKIEDTQNVNALASGQKLNFLSTGITIVYGDNGAGKSGYVRILKTVCRARGKAEDILPNINKDETGPQTATIEYSADGQVQKAAWISGQPIDDALTEVSVFDSCTANVHVEEANSLAYTPLSTEAARTACERL